MARKPPKGKSLAEVNPQLAKDWHPTKNGDLTALDGSLVFQIKFCGKVATLAKPQNVSSK